MNRLISFVIGLCFISVSASAAFFWQSPSGDKRKPSNISISPALVLKKLQVNDAVNGSLKYAKKALNAGAKCQDLEIMKLDLLGSERDSANFHVRAKCSASDGEASITLDIKGSLYSPDSTDAVIESINFNFAG